MGQVRKQGVLSLIFIYAGFAIGAVNTYLFNFFLTQEQYGLTAVLSNLLSVTASFATLGSALTIYRFFPIYNHHLGREKNDLPFLTIAASIIGLSLVLVSLFLFKDLIVRKFSENSPLFVERFYLLVPLTITFLSVILFEAYAFLMKRTVASNMVKEISFRLFQLIIVLLYGYDKISIDTFFVLFSLMYVPTVLIMLWINFSKDGIKINFKISKLTKRLYKVVLNYTAFHFSGALLLVLPMALNSIIIASVSPNGLNDAAVYVLARFFVSVIEAPLRGVTGIYIATISESFHKRDFLRIDRMYKKTSINLLLIGIALFVLMYINIPIVDTLFVDKDYSNLALVFGLIGIGKLFELSMGLNNAILYLSKFWKVEFFISSSVIILSIPVNYLLIKWSPLLGVGIAEVLLIFFLGISRFIAVKKLLKLQPYTIKTIGVLLIGITCFLIAQLLPRVSNIYLDFIIRSSVFGILYLVAIWTYRPSPDLHELLDKILIKFKKK
ncbi:MAG TPA: hypothetical protein VLZ83_14650 [Edaphocola sp.]|nr:hypothetical protein [Edaphocola sp.]